MTDRRMFVQVAVVVLAAGPTAVYAQSSKVSRVGYLASSPRDALPAQTTTIVGRLAELGYVEGKNLAIDFRHAWSGDGLQERARELARIGVQVIFAANPYAIRAARAATATTPIVGYDLETDPIAAGYAASLARPSGNVTGVFLDQSAVSAKQLQLLKELVPSLSSVAVVWDDPLATAQRQAVERAGQQLGIKVTSIAWQGPETLPESLRVATRNGAQGLLILSSPRIHDRHRPAVAVAALKARLPAIGLSPIFARDGLLIAYGPRQLDMWRVAATMIAKILDGARLADIPIERPVRFALAINLKTARALGLTLPPSLLLRADELIEG